MKQKTRKRIVRMLSSFIPDKQKRQEFRVRHTFPLIPKKDRVTTFVYEGKKLPLFESVYNSGFHQTRMTERCIEMGIAKDWIDRMKGDITEIGAVTPYYFKNKKIKLICDPGDEHESITHKCSLFDLNLKGRNILSLSTIEHISTGEYGLKAKKNETAPKGFEKIVKEAKSCLITFPVDYNPLLDKYFAKEKFKKLKIKGLRVHLFVRNPKDNRFTEEHDLSKITEIKYGPNFANGVVIIEK